MAVINLGVDFGSTGLRAAYSVPGEPARYVPLAGAEWPWLLCEPATSGPLPVTFRSLKSKVGIDSSVEVDGRTVNPVEVVTRALDVLRRQVLAESSARIDQTMISVPARFLSSQRTALLKAAGDAGLTKVGLVTDSIAAVIGHTGGAGNGTFLVYGMGYSGFELGLVRAVRGRYHPLGYEGASAPGGGTFDEQVLGAWLELLRRRGTVPDEVQQGEAGWRRLRTTAEQVKEQLAAERRVLFPMFAAGPDGELLLTVQFEQQPFDTLARALVAKTLDRADSLFSRSGMTGRDVDTVLLAGGSTRMAQLRKLISGLGSAAVPTGTEHIARGAALCANQLADWSVAGHEEQLDGTDDTTELIVDAPPLAATLLTAPGASLPSRSSDRPTGVEKARQLIREGRADAAAEELRRLIAEAESLLAEISTDAGAQDKPDPQARTSATQLLAMARRRLEHGGYEHAIRTAHAAWEREPESPDVFEGMIEIHCDAAMANPTIEGFTQDERWLRCALQHDPTSSKIRRLLAERIYLHGKELNRLGRGAEARRVLEHTLSWDPEHQAARELLRRLGRPKSGH